MPLFSVVIPLHNKEAYIKNTLQSVLNQSFKDFEVLIINDGSTDNSLEVVRKISDTRIQIINQENRGLCASRNRGINNANADYVAFLDADDLWTVDFLDTMYNLINLHSNHKIFATKTTDFRNEKRINLASTDFNLGNLQVIKNYFKLCDNITGPSAMVIEKSVFESVGFFDETINYGEEDDFYIRCFNKFELVYYQEPKSLYRLGVENQLTAPNKNFRRKIPDYEKYLTLYSNPDLKKFLDFVHYRLVILFKMERNYELVKFYSKKINSNNLKFVQKIKYYLPTDIFHFSKKIYIWSSRIFTHF